MSSEPPPLPDLPVAVAPDALRDLDDSGLAAHEEALAEAERAVRAGMAPWERLLRELRARGGELATERRRRERAARHAARIAVRAAAGSGELPQLADALSASEVGLPADTPLTAVGAWLATGGAVGFGFASKPGVMTFTDGRTARQATTLGAARDLWADGWEPGAPGVPRVRVHLSGTRIERVVAPTEVVVRVDGEEAVNKA